MSYKFVVRVYQTNTNAFFKPVETSVYKAGTWSNNDGEHILLLGYDTSAAIRLDAGSEHVVVLLGNHDKNVWCDIDTDIGGKSSAQLNMQYYDGVVILNRVVRYAWCERGCLRLAVLDPL
ncbi:fruit body lectin [Pleurotus pulmonarius]